MGEQVFKHIVCELSGGVATLRFRFARGYDVVEYDEIGEELHAAINREGVESVALNLDALDHTSSRLLGMFLMYAKRLSSEGRKLVACRLRPEPLRVFRLCRADSIIPTYASEDEARAALSEKRDE